LPNDREKRQVTTTTTTTTTTMHYLEEPVERNPEEKDISKELHQMKHAVDDPVGQPLGVIVFLLGLNCLDAKQQHHYMLLKVLNRQTVRIVTAMTTGKLFQKKLLLVICLTRGEISSLSVHLPSQFC